MLATLISLPQACFPTNELYQRLWKAFQYNGHLPADVGIPSQFLQGGNTTEQEFLDACHETYRAWNATGKTGMREQKRAALVANYRGVPSDIMEKLRKLYASDFEMFGYDEHPAYLFEDRSAR
ncbi:unnamed protein product [Lymnaea stagnalis]|uniref:Uncharacterized protein n=1 Tax=Lymnaea stagnalis TaxID=6523 RepID=A0AAV2IDD8_LYMST